MKLMDELLKHLQNQVAPHWGAWIEINPRRVCLCASPVAPHWGAWIEISPR